MSIKRLRKGARNVLSLTPLRWNDAHSLWLSEFSEIDSSHFRHPLVKSLGPVDGDLLLWAAEIEGPTGTPYEGGSFSLEIQVTENYPFQPPIVHFTTKIYHCNIHPESGRIALAIMKDQWSPALQLTHCCFVYAKCLSRNRNQVSTVVKQPANFVRLLKFSKKIGSCMTRLQESGLESTPCL